MLLFVWLKLASIGAACIPTSFHWVALASDWRQMVKTIKTMIMMMMMMMMMMMIPLGCLSRSLPCNDISR